jgi:hypothetical protein
LLDKIRALFFNGAANQMISNVILGFLRERLVSHKKILTKGGCENWPKLRKSRKKRRMLYDLRS